MSNIRIFFPESLSLNFNSYLEKPQSHYLTKVMRVKIGENFSLFNKNGEWVAKINNISSGKVEFSIQEKLRNKENLVELGVTKFIPIIFDRTVVRKINSARLEKIIIEATEQSNRINLPSLEKPQNLKSFLKKNENKIDLIFTDLNTKNKKIVLNKDKNKSLCIIIGPEGDFSEQERNNILNFKGVKSFKINENILRSETAVISSISILSYILNL